ncbi:MAG: sulfurtransferase [Chloroflexi bacterium]|nr:sulfurtransferase [Chloroflexota bacterium]
MTTAFVSTDWVAERRDAPGVRLIEASTTPEAYASGHLAGAVAIDWRRELIEREDESSGKVIDPERFAALARRLGLRPDDTLIFYGDEGGRHATRALWTFEYYRHPGTLHWMDGGREKWQAEGRRLSQEAQETQETPSEEASDYPVPSDTDESVRATREEIESRLGDDGFALLDVRTPGEYAGTDVRAARGGRIPGARHLFWKECLASDGALKSKEELAALLGDLPREGTVATYCQLGVRAAHTWFVLRHVLGYANVKNYDGSWQEWGNLRETAIER